MWFKKIKLFSVIRNFVDQLLMSTHIFVEFEKL